MNDSTVATSAAPAGVGARAEAAAAVAAAVMKWRRDTSSGVMALLPGRLEFGASLGGSSSGRRPLLGRRQRRRQTLGQDPHAQEDRHEYGGDDGDPPAGARGACRAGVPGR